VAWIKQAEMASLRQEMGDLSRAHAKVDTDVMALQGGLQQLQMHCGQIQQILTQIKALQASLDSQGARVSTVSDSVADVKQITSRLAQKLDGLWSSHERDHSALEDLRRDVRHLQQAHEELQRQQQEAGNGGRQEGAAGAAEDMLGRCMQQIHKLSLSVTQLQGKIHRHFEATSSHRSPSLETEGRPPAIPECDELYDCSLPLPPPALSATATHKQMTTQTSPRLAAMLEGESKREKVGERRRSSPDTKESRTIKRAWGFLNPTPATTTASVVTLNDIDRHSDDSHYRTSYRTSHASHTTSLDNSAIVPVERRAHSPLNRAARATVAAAGAQLRGIGSLGFTMVARRLEAMVSGGHGESDTVSESSKAHSEGGRKKEKRVSKKSKRASGGGQDG